MILADLHRLDLPTWLAVTWRGALFILACCLLGGFWTFVRDLTLPTSRRILMVALLGATVKWVVVNVERFDQVVFWEGLPLDTLWIVAGAVGLDRWIRERRR